MKNWIIIPDVHGRRFWRKAVETLEAPGHEEVGVIFLGDYVDPYPWEGILPGEAVMELEDIIAFKNRYPGRVVLLLGNHDLGYLDSYICSCRRDSLRAGRLKQLFEDNIDLFDMVHIDMDSGKKVLFSHAGIGEGWVRRRQDIVCVDGHSFHPGRLNELLHGTRSERGMLFRALADVSWYRGGSDPVSSPVWADVDEYCGGEPLLDGYYHVFGHTLNPGGPVHVGDKGVCLDCARAFVMDNGKVHTL